MEELAQEHGKCESCGKEINLEEAWRVNEEYLCQECFENKSL